jgi:methanogenic corrinoid protein MtbC1
LAKLIHMRKLVISGVAPADAAAAALKFKGKIDLQVFADLPEPDQGIISMLHKAVHALDRNLSEQIIRSEFKDNGIAATWCNVLTPVLVIVGEEWATTGVGIEVEHMLSEIIHRLLIESTEQLKSPVNSRPVLLACVGEEIHSLAITALAACLAEDQIQVQFLGARTPQSAINEVVRRVGPPAIFLWAQLAKNGDPAIIQELPKLRPAPRVILGGPGWNPDRCESANFVDDLTAARREISRAVGV